MSHAMLLDLLDTGAIWSVARGLARREAEHKAHLMACDLPRRNDVQPDRLRARILDWVREEQAVGALPPGAERVLGAVLGRGELPRGDVPGLLNASDRHARRITAALVDRGVLVSASSRAPLRITFPAALASRWMPGLFPDASGDLL